MCGYMCVYRHTSLAFFLVFFVCFFLHFFVLFIFSSVSFVFVFLYVCLLACLCPKERKKEGMKLQGWGGRRELEGEKKRKTMIRYSVGKI